MDNLLAHPSTEQGIDRILNSAPHAIGIQGEAESGKKYLSRYIAQKLLGLSLDNHPYSVMIDCSDKIGIEEIRQAIKFLTLKIPGNKTYKRCLIFWSFEKLGREAQNAFLKSLEEPPEDTLIIITTRSKDYLLPTTASRLSWVDVLPVSHEAASEYFKNVPKDKLAKAYTLGEGRPAMLFKLINDYGNHPLVKAIAASKELLKADRFSRIGQINRLSKDEDFDMQLYLRALSKILEAALRNAIAASQKASPKLIRDLKRILEAEKSQNYNSNQKLLLTDIFYNL